jgi:hypothetical protein
MLVGIPMALVAGTVPAVADVAMILPTVAVRWVDTVARVAVRADPPWVIDIVVTLSIPVSLAVAGRFSRRRCANLG